MSVGYGCAVADDRPTVLVLRALALGDLLVAVPALRALRRAYPEHRLVLATAGGLAPLVERIGGVDVLLPTPDPSALSWAGPAPAVAVNLHGTGPQSHRALDALRPGRRIGFTGADVDPGWEGPTWDAVAATHPHERTRWCALLQHVGIPTDPDDLRLAAPGGAGSSPGATATGPTTAATSAAAGAGPGCTAAETVGPPATERGAAERGAPDSRATARETTGPGARDPRTADRYATGPGAAGPLSGATQPGATEPGATGPDGRGPVLVHPGAAFGAKRWPADRFAAVAAALDAPGVPVLLTGSGAERPLAEEVARRAGLPTDRVLAGRTDLGQLCDLVAAASLVVSGDTGVAHLASALGVPSVVLFGPVDPAQWGPPAAGPHIALAHPDHRRGARFADEPDPALLAVTVAEVLAAVAAVRDPPHPA